MEPFKDPHKLIAKQLKGVPEEIALMIMGDDSDDTRSSDDSNEEFEEDECANILKHEDTKAFKPRRTYIKRQQFESNWYVGYLESEEKRETLREDPTHRDTKEFKGLFRVSFTIFEDIVDLHNQYKWYDNNRFDVCGVKCSDIELLVLGALHTLGHGESRWVNQSNTNIDKEVHRR